MLDDQKRKVRSSLVSLNDRGDIQIEINRSWMPKVPSFVRTAAAFIAVATAIGSWLKPQDNTATKASYDTLSQEVKTLSDQTVKNHDDMIAIKSYLDGFTNRVLNEPVEIPSVNEKVLSEAVRESLVKQRIPISNIRKAVHDTISNPPPITSASISPQISPRPIPMKIPDFNSMLEKAKK